jgi:hypothetical protein
MGEQSSQNLGNHARFDPPFHFFILPVFAITFIISIVMLVRNPGLLSAWRVVAAIALLTLAVKARLYALRVQDRIIRLEERIRLAGLLPESQGAQIAGLTEDQLIGLRFACDEEAPALAQKALSEKLSRGEIKKAVRVWRPDYWRV